MYVHIEWDETDDCWFADPADDYHDPHIKCDDCYDVPRHIYLKWQLAFTHYDAAQNEMANWEKR